MSTRVCRLLLPLALIVGVLLVGRAALRAFYAYEQPVAEYATRAEAEAVGAFAGGWLPSFLPPSARALRDVHNLDSNERWLRFEADSVDLVRLAAQMTPLAPSDARRTAARLHRAAGMDWPPELTGQSRASERDARELSVYQDTTAAYRVAIEWRSGRAWGWSCERAG